MCLILFALDQPGSRLVLAANRDEFFARPTAAAAFWQDHPDLLGGRDLELGGTWLGITRSGRVAAVTNFRESPPAVIPPRSRGALTLDFLAGEASPYDYLEGLVPIGDEFRGFNLLVGDASGFCYFSNRADGIKKLSPGVYGLSNQLLDCDWPKVVRSRSDLGSYVSAGVDDPGALFEILHHSGDGSAFSASFIASPDYGTRASTVLRINDSNDVYFEERNFEPVGVTGERRVHTFTLQAGYAEDAQGQLCATVHRRSS